MKTIEKSKTAINNNGQISPDKTVKNPIADKASQKNGTPVQPEVAPDKSEESNTENQNKKAEPGTSKDGETGGDRPHNLVNTLEVVEELHRRKLQRDKLLTTLEKLQSFEIALKENAEETGGNHFQGCTLTIMDDNRRDFTTKNPALIHKLAMFLEMLCLDKLDEIEAKLVLPR